MATTMEAVPNIALMIAIDSNRPLGLQIVTQNGRRQFLGSHKLLFSALSSFAASRGDEENSAFSDAI
jgi:hypothetical protein